MEVISLFFISLVLTIGIEFLILCTYFFFFSPKKNKEDILIISIFASGCTLPYVWFVFPFLFNYGFILGEIFAVLIEAIIYKKYFSLPFFKALLISGVANTISYFLGKVLLEYFTRF